METSAEFYKQFSYSESLVHGDELFVFTLHNDDEYRLTLDNSPARGEFVLRDTPYAWYLIGFDAEIQITIHASSGQNGETALQITQAIVDLGMKASPVFYVKWAKESALISHVVNLLYFGASNAALKEQLIILEKEGLVRL